uniref:Transposase n=1 Tax=Ditylenchus dipsaci TaxID=166011 RepID=A0A915E0J5_9BILA
MFGCLTAHGIDVEWKRIKFVLAIRELSGSHTGECINAAIEKILEEWEISRSKCHVFLRDGAANMKKALEGSFQHADCAAHKMNLAVKSTLSSGRPVIEQCLRKCRSIAGHFAGSLGSVARGYLREIQKDLQLPANNIIQDITTRWNYTLKMVERLLQQKRAVETYFGRHEPAIEVLSAREWRLLKQLIDHLEPADAFTRDVCKNDSHLGLKIATWRMLLKEVESAEVLELAEEKIYWNCGLALFLDPRFEDRCVSDGNKLGG